MREDAVIGGKSRLGLSILSSYSDRSAGCEHLILRSFNVNMKWRRQQSSHSEPPGR